MSEHPIQGLMTTAMDSLKDMVDVNTIIGDPIESPDGTVIITVSKVGFGFAAGGSEFKGNQQGGQGKNNGSQSESMPFGGGSGGGVSITPICFLIVNQKGVQTIHLNQNTHLYDKLLEEAPKALDKVQEMFKGLKEEMSNQTSKTDSGKQLANSEKGSESKQGDSNEQSSKNEKGNESKQEQDN